MRFHLDMLDSTGAGQEREEANFSLLSVLGSLIDSEKQLELGRGYGTVRLVSGSVPGCQLHVSCSPLKFVY